MPGTGSGFDQQVAPGGYAWWYLDAVSDDGQHGLCIIAFIGSVFSPYYAQARRRGSADPLEHCAFNVSLTGRCTRWSMSERGRAAVQRDATGLRIGASDVTWDGSAFTYRLRERGCPLPRAIAGTVRVWPATMPDREYALDDACRHLWSTVAPRARIEVRLTEPALHWQGNAYLDSNRGSRALEEDFTGWTWSRAALPDHTRVFYEVQRRQSPPVSLALRMGDDGGIEHVELPPAIRLPRSGWGIRRETRSEAPEQARVLQTLVDAPFYARSMLATDLSGRTVTAVHESLDLDRFRQRLVQCLLPFRMPRWTPPGVHAHASGHDHDPSAG